MASSREIDGHPITNYIYITNSERATRFSREENFPDRSFFFELCIQSIFIHC